MNKSEEPLTSSQPNGEEGASLRTSFDLESEKEGTTESCSKRSDGPCSAKKPRNMLSFGFLNIHYLYQKLDELQLILCDESNDFNAFALNETFLDASYQDYELQIPGYELIRKDRLEKSGGGVAIFTLLMLSTLSSSLIILRQCGLK